MRADPVVGKRQETRTTCSQLSWPSTFCRLSKAKRTSNSELCGAQRPDPPDLRHRFADPAGDALVFDPAPPGVLLQSLRLLVGGELLEFLKAQPSPAAKASDAGSGGLYLSALGYAWVGLGADVEDIARADPCHLEDVRAIRGCGRRARAQGNGGSRDRGQYLVSHNVRDFLINLAYRSLSSSIRARYSPATQPRMSADSQQSLRLFTQPRCSALSVFCSLAGVCLSSTA
jgi:hypothetical protein